jgi:DNA-binding Lrp family transcriptional regulator
MVLDDIVEATGVEAVLGVPDARVFTLTTSFDVDGTPDQRWAPTDGSVPPPVLSRDERALARLLQGELPLVSRPFVEIAATLEQCGYDVDERWVVDRLKAWLDDGVIRRFAAIVRHEPARHAAALVAWQCSAERLAEVGGLIASFPEVVNCFERVSAPGEPSSIHSVVKGVDRSSIERSAERIRTACGLETPRMLYPLREFKKASMKYFSDAEC